MKWSDQASEAVSKVPFFVRRRVRRRVEEEATRQGASVVTIEHVTTCRQRFLSNMEDEVKGYQVDQCFGPSGCPNRAIVDDALLKDLEALLASKDLKAFLKTRVKGPLKMHHEFRVSLSDCPNACSRPQIVDIGIIGASKPRLSTRECSLCGECVEACKEEAISLADGAAAPEIDLDRCVLCGKCHTVCPTGTIEEEEHGYRILLGGKLGRHPQLGSELCGIFTRDQVLSIVDKCLAHFMSETTDGERFGAILNRTGIDFLNLESETRIGESPKSACAEC